MQYVQNTQAMGAPVLGTSGQALPSNPARIFFQIQNVGVNPLYVFYGGTAASASNYHEILSGGATGMDGTGGIAKSGTVVYTGPIQLGGTAPSAVSYEIGP